MHEAGPTSDAPMMRRPPSPPSPFWAIKGSKAPMPRPGFLQPPIVASSRASREVEDGLARHPTQSVDTPYLTTLGALARELDAQGRGRVDTAAIRLLRQRLTEWIEDLRSVGNANDLAAAVEQLVQRLSGALTLVADLAGETMAISDELSKLAGGAPPPRAPGRAFWK